MPASTSDALQAAAILASATAALGSRATIYDATALDLTTNDSSYCSISVPSPSFAFGQALSIIQQRIRLSDRVRKVLDSGKTGRQLTAILSSWLTSRDDAQACEAALDFSDQWLVREAAFNSDVKALHESQKLFSKPSLWVLMADGLAEDGSATDLGAIHHFLASEEDINVLVLVTDPALVSTATGALPRRDVGLYCLNYGTAYVASTSPVADPGQFQLAVREADAFRGPSVVLAYVPLESQGPSPGAVASEAVAAGRWPLYRWDPAADAAGREGAFAVDSARLREDIQAFVDGANHLSLLSRTSPALAPQLTSSLESSAASVASGVEARLKASFDRLMGAFKPPPLSVLFGSDGGNAEGLAKRLANEAHTRFGFTDVTIRAMDAVGSVGQLAQIPVAVFVVSTAGQGDFPSNARHLWKALSAAAADPTCSDAQALRALKFAVFGLGDSNYWPKKEQRVFYNTASTDLDGALRAAGAQPLVDRGLGDDQDVGGYSSGWKRWLPSLWASLGVSSPTKEDDSAGKTRHPEDVKATSRYLRGTIAQGLQDASTGAISYEDTLLTKFHGIYQQDDRDLRAERKRQGLEPAFSFMVRVRIPGGVCTPAQYLALDSIADTHANGTIRATTRQAVQFHGIIKGLLKPSIAAINRTLMDTLAACGDVNRNVMCNINPHESRLHASTLQFTKDLSDHLTPRTTAYAEIWLDEKQVKGGSGDYEPIYGTKYLPRKFKIGVAVPPSNDVDIYTQDLGYIAISGPDGELEGFNVTIGGGMGMTHNNAATYPRLADVLGYVPLKDAIAVGEAVVTTQRDYGDRSNRKHARMKYTVDDKGLPWFKDQVEARSGATLHPPRPFTFGTNGDAYGWAPGGDGSWSYTFFIQNGRIKDAEGYRLKSGLRAIAQVLAQQEPSGAGEFRFTPNQNLSVARVSEGVKARVQGILESHGIVNKAHSGLRLNSMACVALPTCALSLAESERYLPSLISRLDAVIEQAGLRDNAITIRMTGCPNGCARPYVAEIAFVGRSPGVYNLYLGGGFHGERLNKLYREDVDEQAIMEALTPLIKRFAVERTEGEHFGDFVIRAGIIKATTAGKNFHEL